MTQASEAIPVLSNKDCLGVIATCLSRTCGYRGWLDPHSLPLGSTVPTIQRNARCRTCGQKGAHVEVVWPKISVGLASDVTRASNVAHAAALKQFICDHPFGASKQTA
jgi:hypothetical protein